MIATLASTADCLPGLASPKSPPPMETYRLIRPSLLDLRLRGDFSVVAYNRETLGLCVNTVPLAVLTGTALDQASFNNLVCRLRNRYPRRRSMTR